MDLVEKIVTIARILYKGNTIVLSDRNTEFWNSFHTDVPCVAVRFIWTEEVILTYIEDAVYWNQRVPNGERENHIFPTATFPIYSNLLLA